MAMPGVQKLHEEFGDKGVKVLGINCWENRGGDPAKYMKEKEFTYGLLLKADDVAKDYKVSGIPTFYLIDQEGKILYASSGFGPDKEKEIKKLIKKHMKPKDI
jgi:thioredoxin-related protein